MHVHSRHAIEEHLPVASLTLLSARSKTKRS
jgi:hypothetical protein